MGLQCRRSPDATPKPRPQITTSTMPISLLTKSKPAQSSLNKALDKARAKACGVVV